MMTLSEERPQDAGYDERCMVWMPICSAVQTELQLVLNANHPLVKYVAAHKEDDKNVPLICQPAV